MQCCCAILSMSNKCIIYYSMILVPVVLTPVSANLGLNFNLGFFFLLPKASFSDNFLYFFRVYNHQIVGEEN